MRTNQHHGEVDTRWFQNKLSDSRLSQRRLASMLGLDPAAVSLMLKGRRKMSVKEASELARLLNVSVDEVLTRAGAGMPSKGPSVVNDVKTTNLGSVLGGGVTNDAEFLMRWMELGNYLLKR